MSADAEANRRITALASRREVHRAFQWLHLQEQRLRSWHKELLAIPAPTFHESERARWFVERFKGLGLDHVGIDEAGNALGVLWPDGGQMSGPMLLISAHLDTVFPVGTDTTPTDDGFRINGPGASDNGAGLTALLALAAAIREAGLKPERPVIFAANVGEEGEGDLRGIRHLFEEGRFAGRIGAAIALEGAGTGLVVDRALGSRRFRVMVRGSGGHSWTDAGKPNPIFGLAEAVSALARIELPLRPRTTLNCGTIAGGTSVNSVPEEAQATLDLRSTAALELDQLEQRVFATLEAAFSSYGRKITGENGLRWSMERIGDRPAGELGADAALWTSLRAVDRHLRIATESRIGSTDANWPLSLGIPALAVGCGGRGGGVHTAAEWFEPAGRELALRRTLLLVLDAASWVRVTRTNP